MDELNLNSETYSCESLIKSLVNNKLMSDVCFEVGHNKEKIYSHKLILSLGSPVFERMFYGGLKMDESTPILITDLKAYGFKNMIKYIYSSSFNFKLVEIYETCKACDKYLVHNWKKKILDRVYQSDFEKFCGLIYDQLLKMEDESFILHKEYFKKIIQFNTKSTIESGCLSFIHKDTLIDILKMENLNIKEIDLLIEVERWITYNFNIKKLTINNPKLNGFNSEFYHDLYNEIETKDDFFKLVRNYISYDKIEIDELIKFKNIKNLFTTEEIGQLFLHISFNENLFIDYCKIQRNEIKLSNISTDTSNKITDKLISFTLNVNKNLIINSFKTATFDFEAKTLRVRIFNSNENDKRENLDYGWRRIKISECFKSEITFKKQRLLLKANVIYKIILYFNPPDPPDPSNETKYLEKFNDSNESLELKYENDNNEPILFELNFKKSNHIKKIEFCTL